MGPSTISSVARGLAVLSSATFFAAGCERNPAVPKPTPASQKANAISSELSAKWAQVFASVPGYENLADELRSGKTAVRLRDLRDPKTGHAPDAQYRGGDCIYMDETRYNKALEWVLPRVNGNQAHARDVTALLLSPIIVHEFFHKHSEGRLEQILGTKVFFECLEEEFCAYVEGGIYARELITADFASDNPLRQAKHDMTAIVESGSSLFALNFSIQLNFARPDPQDILLRALGEPSILDTSPDNFQNWCLSKAPELESVKDRLHLYEDPEERAVVQACLNTINVVRDNSKFKLVTSYYERQLRHARSLQMK